MVSSSLAEIVKSLASLYQTQHQALLELRKKQDQHFQALLQAQMEVLWSLVQPAGTPAAAPLAGTVMPHITLSNLGLLENQEAFLELLQCAIAGQHHSGWSACCNYRGKPNSWPNSFQSQTCWSTYTENKLFCSGSAKTENQLPSPGVSLPLPPLLLQL